MNCTAVLAGGVVCGEPQSSPRHVNPDDSRAIDHEYQAEKIVRCRSCGEPEMAGIEGADFGHFTDADGVTVCQRCGTVQP